MTLRVLSVASEAVPLVKTGGLADVVGALPAALAPHGAELTTILPGYPGVLKGLKRARTLHHWPDLLGEEARLVAGRIGGHALLVLDAAHLFQRDGALYTDAAGRDWEDNWRRFAAFGRAAADVAAGAGQGKAGAFDLIHAHDWQGGMALAYNRFAPAGPAPLPSVMTIHNMAFQGYFDARIFRSLGLPKAAWAMDGVESYGGVGFLKAGLQSADAITTVSPSYAAEIRLPEFGMGLEGLIASRGSAVSGILNGIDTAEWNPATDPHLASLCTARTLSGRKANKRALEAEFGLSRDEGPLFVVISRLTWQKGMDVLPEVIDHLVGLGGRLALLGAGDAAIEHELHSAAERHPGRIGIRIGYDEALAHRMQGGGDAILVPSRFEPCGLTQLYGLAYGCVPIVARTGGLADTVIDANVAALAKGVATGVQFVGVNYHALAEAISRTFALYADRAQWKRIQANGMAADFSWTASGKAYAALYRRLTGTKA
ncbi:starch synthase [Novosphingobium kunmingense]|uniref:Glycogen synthase n=1 Tax=Novosphingobium kunmingense TaxID=1211806 RepID=A0A2N0H5I4_9SPHN|nr:glycogen synthase GlgA [Novosphingobium kunmingense]PKB14193.1 starch synthase [Novosphingobium kunmingense]